MLQAEDACIWAPGPRRLSLHDSEVHVWRCWLDRPAERAHALGAYLDPDERAKGRAFRFQVHRRRYTVAHGLLRVILSRYLQREPAAIRYRYNPQGKPDLMNADSPGVRFNLSHSDDLALVAVSRTWELGVDVERVRPDFAGEDVAHHFFSPAEVATLQALPAPLRPRAFFECWTRKEAYIKARGQGLSIPLDGFDVSLAPGAPAALLRVANAPEDVFRWSLRTLSVGPEYAATVVVESNEWTLRCWDAVDLEG